MLDTGCLILDAGCLILDTGCSVLDPGNIQDPETRIEDQRELAKLFGCNGLSD